MSFQLVVVALLAATAAAASRGNRVETSSCTGTECKDGCVKKTYPVGSCKKDGEVYWRAEGCTASTTTFNIKGYSSLDKCKTGKKKKIPTTCAAQATKLVCTAETITLYVCDAKTICEGGSFADDCSKVEFKKAATGTDQCKGALGKYLKVPEANKETVFADGCGGDSVTFEQYDDDKCMMATSGATTKMIKMACTESTDTFYTATCTESDGLKKLKCTARGCAQNVCKEETALPLGKHTKVDGSYWYLEKCPDAGAQEISVDTYDDFKTFTKMCTAKDGSSSSATCVSTRTKTATLPAAPTTAANTTTDDGATARSMAPVGVFALVILAYAL